MEQVNLPVITVVTPSYNQARFLEETILSVAGGGYPRVEHIVIDGGSTDGSVDIIKKYQKGIAYWISEKDGGQSDAINKGFRRATGDIIAWLNSDDRYCDGALNKVGRYFADHPECMWLAGNVLFTHEDGHVFARKRPLYSPFILRHAGASVYQPNVFVRRKILEVCGFPRQDFHTIMDREWFCRIAAHYPPHLINEDLALFRWHPESKSSSTKDTPYYRRYTEERIIVAGAASPLLRRLLVVAPDASLWLLRQTARVLKMYQRLRRAMGMVGGGGSR